MIDRTHICTWRANMTVRAALGPVGSQLPDVLLQCGDRAVRRVAPADNPGLARPGVDRLAGRAGRGDDRPGAAGHHSDPVRRHPDRPYPVAAVAGLFAVDHGGGGPRPCPAGFFPPRPAFAHTPAPPSRRGGARRAAPPPPAALLV